MCSCKSWLQEEEDGEKVDGRIPLAEEKQNPRQKDKLEAKGKGKIGGFKWTLGVSRGRDGEKAQRELHHSMTTQWIG